MNEKEILTAVEMVLKDMKKIVKIPIGISNRHLHLTKEDFQTLFPNQEMTIKKELNQPGEYAAAETVTVIGPKGEIPNVRILGPYRKQSQVELSMTDARKLGLKLPIRLSGDIEGTPGITLKSPHGELDLEKGAIAAQRHIHMSQKDALLFGLKQGDKVTVKIEGEQRGLIFDDCFIRLGENFNLELHIDTDEANAGNINSKTSAKFLTLDS